MAFVYYLSPYNMPECVAKESLRNSAERSEIDDLRLLRCGKSGPHAIIVSNQAIIKMAQQRHEFFGMEYRFVSCGCSELGEIFFADLPARGDFRAVCMIWKSDCACSVGYSLPFDVSESPAKLFRAKAAAMTRAIEVAYPHILSELEKDIY